MAQKSPYEIRFDILEMAKSYMDAIQEANSHVAKQAVELAVKQNVSSLEAWQNLMPKTYTLEDLTAKANELYAFVAGAKNV